MRQGTIFEAAGGREAFLRLAEAHHRRCLEDPVLNHPLSHPGHPEHIERLAGYWAEVLGGPPAYTQAAGGSSAMLALHANTQAQSDLGERFLGCFLRALDDAEFPEDASCARRCGPTWNGPCAMSCPIRRSTRSCRTHCGCHAGRGRACRTLAPRDPGVAGRQPSRLGTRLFATRHQLRRLNTAPVSGAGCLRLDRRAGADSASASDPSPDTVRRSPAGALSLLQSTACDRRRSRDSAPTSRAAATLIARTSQPPTAAPPAPRLGPGRTPSRRHAVADGMP